MNSHPADLVSLVVGVALTLIGSLAVTGRLGTAFDDPAPWLVGVAMIIAVLIAAPALRRNGPRQPEEAP